MVPRIPDCWIKLSVVLLVIHVSCKESEKTQAPSHVKKIQNLENKTAPRKQKGRGPFDKLNLPLAVGEINPLGVPLPEGYRFKGRLRHQYSYSGTVSFRKTLEFYRRVLDTVYIEEREKGYWILDRAKVRTSENKDLVSVEIRSRPKKTTIIRTAPSDPMRRRSSIQGEKQPRKRKEGFADIVRRNDPENRQRRAEEKKNPEFY